MTSFKINLTAVGAFVIAAIVSLVLLLAILTGRTGPTDRYYTVFPNVFGLKFGTKVDFEGFPVGQIADIEPVEQDGRTQFRVEMAVKAGWKIPEDSVANSTALGLLAPQTIAITAGKSARMLKPGGTIRPGTSGNLFANLSGTAEAVNRLTSQGMLPLIENMNRQVQLVGDVIVHDIRPLVQNANRILGPTAENWPRIIGRAEKASTELADVSGRVNRLFDQRRMESIARMLDAAAQTSANLQALSEGGGADLRAAAQELRLTTEALSLHAESFSENLDESSRNFAEFSRRIRDNPGLLLRGGAPRDTSFNAQEVPP